ncbi:MAG: preprotein translocase subunit SecA [Deltaproteobacteria bacterium]|nr:preprotein translocase subunit SecA [Deltaproteobacteria bacterium]
MFQTILKKIFGTANERTLKSFQPQLLRVNELEPRMQAMSDAELQAMTPALRERLRAGETLEDLLPEAFAVCREASRRVLGMRHYDVQILGGIGLHRGMITEMKTGEGKTLVATLPVYLNALEGKGVHVVTVNDYLATRDSEWMGRVYRWLGLTVGVIVHGLDDRERQEQYGSDITYGTNNEFGFDYLRDHMKFEFRNMVHRYYWPENAKTERERAKIFNYAIVDEVDSILIDEARTPLIISGPSDESTDKYYKANGVIPFLKRDQDYLVDEKSETVTLTDTGVDKVERRLGVGNLYDAENMEWLHHMNQALRAHTLFKRDVRYLLENGKVVIIDEHTGRKMPGRRWSDGLHQAIEAKEGVHIEEENQTLATVTFQNLFRMYKKLAGMTGTADTEAEEFAKTYDLEVLVVPTHMNMIREDRDDVVYKTERAKFAAVTEDIKRCHAAGQPVLVGTISVEKSELLSKYLKNVGIPHNVLNAKNHAREAEIVAQAGRKAAVTISTNMAGRGTDIVLGGNPEFLARSTVGADTGEAYEEALRRYKVACAEEKKEVIAAGGLYVLGTERHESRRIDNQLRGRSGRQGDPGASRFYMSLEDDLLRIFGAERVQKIMNLMNVPEDEPIIHRWITRAIEGAQKRVEGHNFDIRKNLLEYDDVMNQQRLTIYELRRRILEGKETHLLILDAVEELVDLLMDQYCSVSIAPEEWDLDGLREALRQVFITDLPFDGVERTVETVFEHASGRLKAWYEERQTRLVEGLSLSRQADGEDEEAAHAKALERWQFYERESYLRELDKQWKDHLLRMDHLKEGVHLEGYASKDPKLIYKKEGFKLFEDLIVRIKENLVRLLFRVELKSEQEIEALRLRRRKVAMQYVHGQTPGAARPEKQKTVRREGPKLGRNDPCHCGSGKKYKQCCLRKDELAALDG